MTNILVIGDIVGSPGRAILKKALPVVTRRYDVDYVIANVENAAGGFGVTREICDELLALGVDCMTSGNHIWDKKEIIPVLPQIPQLLRPANYPARQPGRGTYVGRGKDSGVPVATLNLSGRVFMNGAIDDPFSQAERLVEELRREAKVVIVDFHAEATSEKNAMGHFLDGRVAGVVGTHTHVPTCDHRVLAKGTAYCTDLGMTRSCHYPVVVVLPGPLGVDPLGAVFGRFEDGAARGAAALYESSVLQRAGGTPPVERQP